MKYASRFLFPILAISCFLGTKLQANYDEIKMAGAIMSEFGEILKDFLNRDSKQKIDSYITAFGKITADIDALTATVQTNYNNTKSIKEQAFLSILKDIQVCVREIYSALATKSLSNLLYAFKKHTSRKFLKSLKTRLINAKKYLVENEIKLVEEIIANSDSLLSEIPDSDLQCGLIIRKAMNRRQ